MRLSAFMLEIDRDLLVPRTGYRPTEALKESPELQWGHFYFKETRGRPFADGRPLAPNHFFDL
jgi:hypothetical protein